MQRGKIKKKESYITFSRNEVYFPPSPKEAEKRINRGEWANANGVTGLRLNISIIVPVQKGVSKDRRIWWK